jgi:hypothetical protein
MITQKIQSNCKNFFSKIEIKLQLFQFLYTTAPRYANINEDLSRILWYNKTF